MKTYEYKGYRPYGAAQSFSLDAYIEDNFSGNVVESILAEGLGSFYILDENNAVLKINGENIQFITDAGRLETPNEFKLFCIQLGLGQTEVSRRFDIPLRTVQDWYSGRRTPPGYVVKMMQEILVHDIYKCDPTQHPGYADHN